MPAGGDPGPPSWTWRAQARCSSSPTSRGDDDRQPPIEIRLRVGPPATLVGDLDATVVSARRIQGSYRVEMAVSADAAASALVETWQHLFPAIPGGWVRRENRSLGAVSGVALPTLNGVWSEQADPDPRTVAALLDEVAATGLPHCLQVRADASPALAQLAERRGMERDEDVPLMVLEGPAALERAQEVDALAIRQLAPAEARLHASAIADGFGAPEEPFVQLMTSAVLALPGVRCYLGEVDGQPVTTGLGVRLGDFVGIFNIATPPEHRGHGYGAAVTARAVADGLADRAAWSWLQSSPAGYPVYGRLGFRTVESWQCYLFTA